MIRSVPFVNASVGAATKSPRHASASDFSPILDWPDLAQRRGCVILATDVVLHVQKLVVIALRQHIDRPKAQCGVMVGLEQGPVRLGWQFGTICPPSQ